MANENQQNKTLQFTKQELAVYVERSVKQMKALLSEYRHKPGYRNSNPYENMIDKFGTDPLELIAEAEKIQAKQSNLSSGIRAAIKEVVDRAVQMMIRDRVNPQKPAKLPDNVKVVTPEQLKDLPENAHLHIPMPNVPGVVMMDSPSSKKGRRARK